MGLGVVRNLIACPRQQGEGSAILKLRMKFPFQAQQDMALAAPVIGQVGGGDSTMRTRMAPNCCVRHRAKPVSPAWREGSMVDQSVTSNGMLLICIGHSLYV